MNAESHGEILCTTQLSPSQLLALAAPSGRFVVFAVLMFALWGALLPITSIGYVVLVAALVLAALRLSILAIGLFAYKRRVTFDGDRVRFLQGSHCVATLIASPDEIDRITILDPRWTPRRLQIVKANGETLETLYGVAKSDLTAVVKQLQKMLSAPRNG